MNEESPSNSANESEHCEIADVSKKLQGSFHTATNYLRENPWIGVAAGAVIGAAIFACAKTTKQPEPTNLDKLRDLLDDVYAKLPSKKEAKSAVNSLLNKLHIPV